MCLFLGAAAAGAGIGSALSAVSTIAGIGLSIMQAAASNAAAQAEYQNQLQYRKQMETQAQKTLNLQVAQQQAALESEKDKAQGAKADYAIQGYAMQSRAQAVSAESGIVGLSVDNLIGDIRGRTNRALAKIDANAAIAGVNANNELKMAQRGYGAKLAEIPIPTPPINTMGLQVVSAVVSGIGQLGKLQIGSTVSKTPGYYDASNNYLF